MKPFIHLILLALLVVGCTNSIDRPTVESVVAVATTETPIPTLTLFPTATATTPPTTTATPKPTATVTATSTPTQSPTPLPVAHIQIVEEGNGSPLPDIIVTLTTAEGVSLTQTTDDAGIVIFADLEAGTSYMLQVVADGYLETTTSLTIVPGVNEVTVTAVAVPPTITPSPTAMATATLAPTATAVATAVATAAPVQPVAPPPPAASTAGNLLVNPSFESGTTGWGEPHNFDMRFYNATDSPQFVHSGNLAAFTFHPAPHRLSYNQYISGLTPGVTYRAGIWVKLWSSSGEDRTHSENPGAYAARLCLNPLGDAEPTRDTNICTGFVQPFDTWIYLSIDAVAAGETMAIILHSTPIGSDLPVHNETIWDDASLIIAPVASTPTPVPAGPPVRPAPVPFDGVTMRDSMTNARWVLEQVGGLLDRLYNGSTETCSEYNDYYGQLVSTATYDSVPAEWQSIYNEYIFAVENGINSNNGVASLCAQGGGQLGQQAYGEARMGINTSLEHLSPAIDNANTLLGQ